MGATIIQDRGDRRRDGNGCDCDCDNSDNSGGNGGCGGGGDGDGSDGDGSGSDSNGSDSNSNGDGSDSNGNGSDSNDSNSNGDGSDSNGNGDARGIRVSAPPPQNSPGILEHRQSVESCRCPGPHNTPRTRLHRCAAWTTGSAGPSASKIAGRTGESTATRGESAQSHTSRDLGGLGLQQRRRNAGIASWRAAGPPGPAALHRHGEPTGSAQADLQVRETGADVHHGARRIAERVISFGRDEH
ncbi:hypothetical protein ACTI_83330 [Actinoplanes sp. OR16]|nr:hypothetical protein ACTI_83330 [Actinoplanes sp. OR16]